MDKARQRCMLLVGFYFGVDEMILFYFAVMFVFAAFSVACFGLVFASCRDYGCFQDLSWRISVISSCLVMSAVGLVCVSLCIGVAGSIFSLVVH